MLLTIDSVKRKTDSYFEGEFRHAPKLFTTIFFLELRNPVGIGEGEERDADWNRDVKPQQWDLRLTIYICL
jgi:hypothetical protein